MAAEEEDMHTCCKCNISFTWYEPNDDDAESGICDECGSYCSDTGYFKCQNCKVLYCHDCINEGVLLLLLFKNYIYKQNSLFELYIQVPIPWWI